MVSFSGFVLGSKLSQHTFSFIQSCLFPYYFHIGSACAFFNLTIFAVCHPSELLNEEENMQVASSLLKCSVLTTL